MKKLLFFTAIFIVASYLGISQVNTKKDLPDGMIPDTKYWFSQTQLQNSVELAIRTKQTVRRCYIDGLEFTQQGQTNRFGPKDSKAVARISDADKSQHVIKVVFSHPDDIKGAIFRNSNVQFIKYLTHGISKFFIHYL